MSDVRKEFVSGRDTVTVMDRANFAVAPGDFVAIVGGSGCGKSTLLSLVAGLALPTAGQVHVDGRVSLMFQDATLLPWLTAAQNVELALRLQGVERQERQERARQLLGRVRLGSHADKRPHELSGGMRQRVALARVSQQVRIVKPSIHTIETGTLDVAMC